MQMVQTDVLKSSAVVDVNSLVIRQVAPLSVELLFSFINPTMIVMSRRQTSTAAAADTVVYRHAVISPIG